MQSYMFNMCQFDKIDNVIMIWCGLYFVGLMAAFMMNIPQSMEYKDIDMTLLMDTEKCDKSYDWQNYDQWRQGVQPVQTYQVKM